MNYSLLMITPVIWDPCCVWITCFHWEVVSDPRNRLLILLCTCFSCVSFHCVFFMIFGGNIDASILLALWQSYGCASTNELLILAMGEIYHSNGDVTWEPWRCRSPLTRLFVSQLTSKIHQRSTFTETEIFITGCTRSCHFGNFQCSQWWTFHQNYDIFVSALVTSGWPVGFLHKTKGQQSGKYFQVLTSSWLRCFVRWHILIHHCCSPCSSGFHTIGTPLLTWFNFNPYG